MHFYPTSDGQTEEFFRSVKEGGGSSSSSKDPKGVKKDMTKKKEKWSESESLKVATAISLAGVAKGFSILHDRFVVDEIACACDAGASELLFVIFNGNNKLLY